MSSQCKKIDEYLDGQLDPSSQVEFVEHLETCDLCLLKIEIEGNLDANIADAWESVNAPESLRFYLRSESEIEDDLMLAEASKPFRRAAIVACLAVSAMIILALSVTLFRSPADERLELVKIEIGESDTQKIKTELIQLPLAKAIQSRDSTAIFVPQTSTTSFTILKAYPTFSSKSKLNETVNGENL